MIFLKKIYGTHFRSFSEISFMNVPVSCLQSFNVWRPLEHIRLMRKPKKQARKCIYFHAQNCPSFKLPQCEEKQLKPWWCFATISMVC